MKLKQILPYIDFTTTLRIFVLTGTPDEDEVAWEGPLNDLPWIYADMFLVEEDENSGSESIAVFGVGKMRITLKEH